MTLRKAIAVCGNVPQPEGKLVLEAYEQGILDHSTALHVIATLLYENAALTKQIDQEIVK